MDVDGIVRNLRVLVRANTITASIHGRQFAMRSGLTAFAGLVGAFGILMLGIALFFALETIWGRVWAAVAVGGINIVLAALLLSLAARVKPGREMELANEVRDAALDSLVGSVREAGTEVSAIAHAIRHPFDSAAVASFATPLVSILLKTVKERRKAAEDDKPRE